MQQEVPSSFSKPLVMSQDGLKSISQIYYTEKFKNIQWTSEIDRELPLKCTDAPVWSKEFEIEAAKAK